MASPNKPRFIELNVKQLESTASSTRQTSSCSIRIRMELWLSCAAVTT